MSEQFHHPRPGMADTNTTAQVEPVVPAFVANAQLFEDLSGQHLHPKAFDLHPQGNRIIVAVDEVPEEWGAIRLPDSVRALESMGMGWVLSAGPQAGQGIPYPGGPILSSPAELLYRHVYFGQQVGKVIRLDISDRSYKSHVLLMADRDIWCIDTAPDRALADGDD